MFSLKIKLTYRNTNSKNDYLNSHHLPTFFISYILKIKIIKYFISNKKIVYEKHLIEMFSILACLVFLKTIFLFILHIFSEKIEIY